MRQLYGLEGRVGQRLEDRQVKQILRILPIKQRRTLPYFHILVSLYGTEDMEGRQAEYLYEAGVYIFPFDGEYSSTVSISL